MNKLNHDKALGAMLGVAIGDALGGPVEFMTPAEITAKHGGKVREMIGGGWLNLAPGEITDDTQMTLLVAWGIVADPNAPVPAIGEQFKKWLKNNPKDVGNTCRAVITEATQTKARTQQDWLAIAEAYDKRTGGESAGNGALMRTVYPAIYYGRDWAHRPAAIIGRMTHWHDHSTKAVICYTNAIAELARAPEMVKAEEWAKERIEYRMKIVTQQAREQRKGEPSPPSGYVIDSADCATEAVLRTESFEEAIVEAINHGGDADTIGAIAGGLAGAVYGAKAIPSKWLSKLDKGTVDKIERLVKVAEERQEAYENL